MEKKKKHEIKREKKSGGGKRRLNFVEDLEEDIDGCRGEYFTIQKG